MGRTTSGSGVSTCELVECARTAFALPLERLRDPAGGSLAIARREAGGGAVQLMSEKLVARSARRRSTEQEERRDLSASECRGCASPADAREEAEESPHLLGHRRHGTIRQKYRLLAI